MRRSAQLFLSILSLLVSLHALGQRDRPGGGGIPIGFSNELGVVAGPVAFYGDYGQRGNFATNIGNTGWGFALAHYVNFAYRADCQCYNPDTYFNDRFKIRTELTLHKTNFQHFGQWVSSSATSFTSDQLRAMKGSSTVFDVGVQLEYYIWSIRDFMAQDQPWAPYFAAGLHWVGFDPYAYSDFGNLNTPITTPDKYYYSFQQAGGSTWSIVTSVGTRYKISKSVDFLMDWRWQYYFSNWVDGLNPQIEYNTQALGLGNGVPVPENKANDWIFWINFGGVFYLN